MRSLALVSLLYLASCSKTPPQEPATPAAPAPAPDLAARAGGKWVEETFPPRLGYATISALTIRAENEVENFVGAKVLPKLTVSCGSGAKAKANMLSIGVITGFPVATETEKGQPEGQTIAIKLDDDGVVTDRWFATEDKLMLMTQTTVETVVAMVKSDTMLFEFKPLKSKSVVARFDLRGMSEHLKLLMACDKQQ